MPREYRMYINGEWVGALDGQVYDDLNPYTGEVFAKVSSGKRADAKRAVDAAAAAFPAWSQSLPVERQALFLKAADILEGASKGNSALLHTGFDEPAGSLEFQMNRSGYAIYRRIHERMNLPFERTGAVVVAWDDEQHAKLAAIAARANANVRFNASLFCRRNSAIVLWSGFSPPINHMNATL